MSKTRISALVLMGMLAISNIFFANVRAYADNVPTFVVIDPIAPVKSGGPFQVTGGLYRHTETGQEGIPQRSVSLYIEPDGITTGPITQTTLLAKVFSNQEGRLNWVVRDSLIAGHYRLYFIYEGSPRYSKSNAVIDISVIGSPPVTHNQPATSTSSSKPIVGQLAPVRLVARTIATDIIAGQTISIIVRLSNARNIGLAKQNVRVKLPEITQQQVTAADGVAVFTIKNPLPAGKHVATILFGGAPGYERTQAMIGILVNPAITTTLALKKATDDLYVGADNTMTAQLATQDNQPIKTQLVRFYLDNEFRYGVFTDIDGQALLRLPREMIAGSHTVSVTFRGDAGFAPSEQLEQITLLPRPFEVHTIPPLPQVKIQIGQQIIQTDPQGVARLLVQRGGEQTVSVLPYEFPNATIKARFDRWSDDVYSATRTINVNNGKAYQIGFELSYPVETLFVEANTGRMINPNRLNNIRLINSAGDNISLEAIGEKWIKANRITKRESTLESSALVYYIQNVTAEGVNVVNEGQQKFEAHPNAQWKVNLQMHNLKITAYDALSGFPIGTGAQLIHPSGKLDDIVFDGSSQAEVQSLARGSYTVTVSGAYGIRTPMPVSLSQNQDVQIAIISYFDIFIIFTLLLAIVLITLAVGRPAVFQGLRGAMSQANV